MLLRFPGTLIQIMATQQAQSAVNSASARNTQLFVLYITVLVGTALLVALLTYLSWRAGNRLQEAIQADANARIQEAHAAASQADEKAKHLDNSNLKLQKDLTIQAAALLGLDAAAANAKAAQQRVEIELAKQQTLAAEAESQLSEVRRRERIIYSIRVVVSFTLPNWRPQSSTPSPNFYRPGNSLEDLANYLGCPHSSLPLVRSGVRITPSGMTPSDAGVSHTHDVIFSLADEDKIIGKDVQQLAGCRRLSVSVMSIDKALDADMITQLRELHARIEINSQVFALGDAMVNGPQADLRDKPFVHFVLPDTASDIPTQYLTEFEVKATR